MSHLLSLFLLIFSGSCTLLTQKIQVPHESLDGPQILTSERDWGWLRESVSTDLVKMEKQLAQNPTQQRLRANIIRSYSMLSALVFESLALEEKLLKDKKYYFERTQKLHSKAVEHGKEYLKQKNVEFSQLSSTVLSQQMAPQDFLALLYLAKSLAALGFENSTSLTEAKVIFDWLCPQAPMIESGECPLFYARFEIKTHPILATKIYRRFIQENPYHLLARIYFMENVLIELQRKDEFEEEFYLLEDGIRKWQEGAGAQELNLYNAIAKMRFRTLQLYKNKLFDK